MFNFELERGSKKFSCPRCQKKTFVRYAKQANGEHLSSDVGRCDRETSCGFHRKPKEYFDENPHLSDFPKTSAKKKTRPNYGFIAAPVELKQTIAPITPKPFDYIPSDALFKTLANYEKNAFVQFLLDLFPEDVPGVEKAIRGYFVGTYEHTRGDYTCFPSIDSQRRVCRAKLIRFNQSTGKRLKGDYDTSSLPAMLKLIDFQYKQIFFGEHLLTLDKQKPVAVVEAEKTAIIASICFPQFIWVGSNSKSWLNAKRLEQLSDRQIILYPDADGFELWTDKAKEARRSGLCVKVSSLIEKHATSEQKANGYDLADYLIEQQKEINEYNAFANVYNTRLEAVLQDEKLNAEFNLILDERKSVMMIDGNLSEKEAEKAIRNALNFRGIVLAL